jgi:ribosomal protein L30E
MTRLEGESIGTTSVNYLEGLIMNSTRITASFLLLSALCIGAQAQTAVSRDEVRNEWAKAVRSGDVPGRGEAGLTLREMNPERYAKTPVAAAKTRAEVKAELAEAVRTGDIMASGEGGMSVNELHQQTNAATALSVNGKTREQVKFELAEAIRTGDVVTGESGMKLYEIYPQRYAAARAVNMVAQRSSTAASAVAR